MPSPRAVLFIGIGLANGMRVAMEHIVNKHILIVDDDERMSCALGKVLHGAGAAVTRTTRAEEAIEILIRRERSMDLVITDLRMPVIMGTTLVYALRLMFPRIPVIVLTAFGTPELQAECLGMGAADFLEKTVDAPHLLAAIDHVFAPPRAGDQPLAEAV